MEEYDLKVKESESACKICGRMGTSHLLALVSNGVGSSTEFAAVICPECAELMAEAFDGKEATD